MNDELKEGTVFNFENEEYVLYKLTEYMNSKYIVSLGYKNPKDVKIFEYKIEDGKDGRKTITLNIDNKTGGNVEIDLADVLNKIDADDTLAGLRGNEGNRSFNIVGKNVEFSKFYPTTKCSIKIRY